MRFGFSSDNLLAFLIGSLCFTSLSFYLSVQVLALPFYLWEHVIIIFLLIYFSNNPGAKFRTVELILFLLLVSVWFVLFIITRDSELFEILSAGRPWLIMGLFAIIAVRLSDLSEQMVFAFAFGMLSGEILSYLIALNSEEFSGIYYLSYMVVFYFIIAGLRLYNSLLFVFLISIPYAVLSGFRVVLMVVFISIFCILVTRFYLMSKIFLKNKFLDIFIGISAIAFLAYVFADQIPAVIKFRVFDRLFNFLSGNIYSSQDEDKIYMILNLFNLTELNIFPSGFNMISAGSLGLFMDNPILHFVNVFGLIFGVLLIALLLCVSITFWFRKVGSYVNVADQVALYFVPLFPLLLLLNGRFTYITYDAALFGFIVGRWFAILSFSKFTHNARVQNSYKFYLMRGS